MLTNPAPVPPVPSGVIGGVLVGGSSSRLGSPKQLLELAGRSFLERVVTALEPLVDRVVLLGSGPVPAPLGHLTRLIDPPGVAGPAAGLLAGLRWAPGCDWLLAACDLPLLRPEAVSWLLAQRSPERWAIVPRSARGVEPTLAWYSRRVRPELEAQLTRGNLALHPLSRQKWTYVPEIPAHLESCWRNVNTLEELESLKSEGRDGNLEV